MMAGLRIIKPGQIVLLDGRVAIRGWIFDTSDAEEISDDAIAAAVRDYISDRIDAGIEEPRHRRPVEKCTSPVSTEVEREAEMETYLLINRCQGIA